MEVDEGSDQKSEIESHWIGSFISSLAVSQLRQRQKDDTFFCSFYLKGIDSRISVTWHGYFAGSCIQFNFIRVLQNAYRSISCHSASLLHRIDYHKRIDRAFIPRRLR